MSPSLNFFQFKALLQFCPKFQVDACSEIVDRAQKELNIEKQLKKIEDTWAGLTLVFAPYQDTDIMAMTIEDVITETLENDNLQLQNM